MSNRAAFLVAAKGEIIVRDAEIPKPGEGEVLIKVHASGIQPADTKVSKHAMLDIPYPTVLGSPVAGVVEAVGPGVTKVSVGERVASATRVFITKIAAYGGLQRYTLVAAAEVVEIGDVDFTKVATLISNTPSAVLFGRGRLEMHWPTIPASPLPASEQGKKILIWGGSSAMGSLCISYAKLAGYTVVSTSSPHNFDLLKACGADYIFDHSDAAVVDKIRDLFPIDYWLDTISLNSSVSTILKILAPEGKPVTKAKLFTLLPLTMYGITEYPEGITTHFHQFAAVAPENADWAKHFLARGGYIESVIKQGLLRGVPPNVLGGLDAVAEGLDKVEEGVSGQKIVIEPWA